MKTYYIHRDRDGRLKISLSSMEWYWDGLLSPVVAFTQNRLWMELVFVIGVPLLTLITMMVTEVSQHQNHVHHNHDMIPWLYVIWFVVSRVLALVYTNRWVNYSLSNQGFEVIHTVRAMSVADAYNAYASLDS
jgi:hypothetical protein